MNIKILSFSLFLGSLLSGTVTPVLAESEWLETGHRKHIRILVREIPDSPLIEVRGLSTLNAGIEKIAHILKDYTRYTEWVPRLAEAELIEQVADNEWREYSRIGLPWPVTDRDFVLQKKIDVSPDQNQIFIHVRSVNSPESPVEGKVVRAEIISASIHLTRIAQDKTHIDATMQLDLKGLIPDFVNHYVTREWPVKTIRALRSQARKTDIIYKAESGCGTGC